MNRDVVLFPIEPMLTGVEVANPQVHESENRLRAYFLEEKENMLSCGVFSQTFG